MRQIKAVYDPVTGARRLEALTFCDATFLRMPVIPDCQRQYQDQIIRARHHRVSTVAVICHFYMQRKQKSASSVCSSEPRDCQCMRNLSPIQRSCTGPSTAPFARVVCSSRPCPRHLARVTQRTVHSVPQRARRPSAVKDRRERLSVRRA